MTIKPCPIIGSYDAQRFEQFSPEDAANWVMTKAPSGKKGGMSLYPALGRQHVTYLDLNRLIFAAEPRGIFKTVNYWYVVVTDSIYQIDAMYNQILIGHMNSLASEVYFTRLDAVNATFSCFTDGINIYVYQEVIKNPSGAIVTPAAFFVVTDPNAPQYPTYIVTFGNRLVVSSLNSTQFNLSAIFLGGIPWTAAEANTCFTISGQAVFAQANGVIKQLAVLNNTLYIFTPYTTAPWSENPSQLVPAFGMAPVTFPFKNSSSYNWDFGMADPLSLDTDFNMMVWLAQNQNGLVQVMMSTGERPKPISTKAISVLFQKNQITGNLSPFIEFDAQGFLYQYENTIYYRISAGLYTGTGILDQTQNANSIEYNFETETWERCIEANGERNRIEQHVFFNNTHYVTVQGDNTIYEMSGNIYTNDITNPAQSNPQAADAYITLPMRYERITPIIFEEEDYSEFITDYVQIDFVWGNQSFINSQAPFNNAVYIIDEAASPIDGTPQFMVTESDPNTFIIAEGSNTPVFDSANYNYLFKPHIELYFSDDGGINFFPSDVLEFSQLGIYSWRMRWYQQGPSRNRVYKLICVSPSPIVILGACMDVRRASGGAN